MRKQRYRLFIPSKSILLTVLLFLLLALAGCSGIQPDVSAPAGNIAVIATDSQKKKVTNAPVSGAYNIRWDSTPDSSCFSQIGYDHQHRVLGVTFRTSGKSYLYLDFSQTDWEKFNAAASLGSWYNSYIKNSYEYEPLD